MGPRHSTRIGYDGGGLSFLWREQLFHARFGRDSLTLARMNQLRTIKRDRWRDLLGHARRRIPIGVSSNDEGLSAQHSRSRRGQLRWDLCSLRKLRGGLFLHSGGVLRSDASPLVRLV